MAQLYQKDLRPRDLLNPNFWYSGNPIHWGWFRRFANSLADTLIKNRIAELVEAVPTTCPRWLWDCLGHRFLEGCYGLRLPTAEEKSAFLEEKEIPRRSPPQLVRNRPAVVPAMPAGQSTSPSVVATDQLGATASPTSPGGSANSCEAPVAYSVSYPWTESMVVTASLDAWHPDPLQQALGGLECGARPLSAQEFGTLSSLNPVVAGPYGSLGMPCECLSG